MSALSTKLRSAQGGNIHFWCPGCNQAHNVNDGWTWNNDVNKPTFSPSILVRYYKISPEGEALIKQDLPPPNGKIYPGKDFVCHSFITNGQIQFLNDCTHHLAGKTVALPDWTEIDT